MGITLDPIRTGSERLYSLLFAIDKQFGDADGTIEVSDYFLPEKSYADSDLAQIAGDLHQMTIQDGSTSMTTDLTPPQASFSSLHADITTALAKALGLEPEIIVHRLRVSPDASAYSGDSSDKAVVSNQLPAEEKIRDSSPQLLLGLLGVPLDEIGSS